MKKIYCQKCGKELICLDKEIQIIDNNKQTIYTYACDDCNIDYQITENEIIKVWKNAEDKRIKENRKLALESLREFAFSPYEMTDQEIRNAIRKDYENLIELRDRIANSPDNELEIYEEDKFTLDHALDYFDQFLALTNIINEQ